MFSIFSMLKVFNIFQKGSFMRLVIKVGILAGLLEFLFCASVLSQTILNSFPSPGPEPRGLAWDGSFLWCVDYYYGKVFKLDPSTGAKVDSFSFPLESNFGGVTWGSDDQIWVANGGLIYEIDPASAETLSSFSCPGG
jgi:streptogramin lyase